MTSNPRTAEVSSFQLSVHPSIRELGEGEYTRVLGEDAPPFLSFAWLDALERTGCASRERGWQPAHLALRRGAELVAVAPAYIKGNSEGEFVFDHAWARFAEGQLGVPYYPKLVLAVPFTPATGPRIACLKGADHSEVVAAMSQGIRTFTDEQGLSGAHVLFSPEGEAEELGRARLMLRYGLQFHWQNAGYGDFDEFLARFSSKRRHQIRRERREVAEQNVEIRSFTGRDIGPEVLDTMYEFYCSTVDKFFWGRRYLNRNFFHEVGSRMPEQLHIVLAFERGSRRALGGAFNLLGKRALYGRYWGAHEERPFLHFNVCFYHSIDECIARGLELFEPGAGGEHKVARGFEPSLTYSTHYLRDRRLSRAVEDFLARERLAHLEHIESCRREPVLKPRQP